MQNVDLRNQEEKNKCLTAIFLYHRLNPSAELQETWANDLLPFSAEQIKTAWDIWRKDPALDRNFLKSQDIVRLINSFSKKPAEETKKDVPQLGKSISTDMMLSRVHRMYRNMPNLEKRLAETKNPFEKMAICAAALGDENVMKNEFVKYLCRKAENAI